MAEKTVEMTFPKIDVSQKEKFYDTFILVEAEKLSLKDDFLSWEPKTSLQTKVKNSIIEAIKSGVKNFLRPKYDPSLADDGYSIRFISGEKPNINMTYTWWVDAAKRYYPLRNSRLGTKNEYYAFIGVLMKKLMESGKTLEWVWKSLCDDSKELGNFWNSKNSQHDIELTGSRCICDFCDLGNTSKFLAGDEDAPHYRAGGTYYMDGNYKPLAKVDGCNLNFEVPKGYTILSVGWIVLS